MPFEGHPIDRQHQRGIRPLDSKAREGIITEQIVSYFGYFEETSLKQIATRCVKMVISDCFSDLCADNFQLPSFEEMSNRVLDEMRQHFDEKVVPLIEETYPEWTDEELETEIDRLEKMYQKEYQEQLDSITNAALKDLRIRTKAIQKDLKAVKRKYTI